MLAQILTPECAEAIVDGFVKLRPRYTVHMMGNVARAVLQDSDTQPASWIDLGKRIELLTKCISLPQPNVLTKLDMNQTSKEQWVSLWKAFFEFEPVEMGVSNNNLSAHAH